MAEELSEALELPDQEAGVLFRAEMWLTNALLGYWKHLVAIVGLVLLGILIYGEYNKMYINAQRATTQNLSDVRAELEEIGAYGALSDDDRTKLVAAADRVSAIGSEAVGTARVEAYLYAAEWYRLAGERAQQRAALEAAVGDAGGALRYAVEGALANLDLEEGKGDEALARWRKMFTEMDGMLGQKSGMDLGLALEHLERPAEAAMVYGELLARWPDAVDRKEIIARKERLEQQGS